MFLLILHLPIPPLLLSYPLQPQPDKAIMALVIKERKKIMAFIKSLAAVLTVSSFISHTSQIIPQE